MEKKGEIGQVEGIKKMKKEGNKSMGTSKDITQSEKLRYKNADKIYE
ncbi:hypothetical protein [Oceanobacillus zhaokaii]|nr:hypothetical protein [Oceanobacillus zhaokaii]